MDNEQISLIFAKALQLLEERYKSEVRPRGFQSELHKITGISPTYLNDILRERKTCPEEKRRAIVDGVKRLLPSASEYTYDAVLDLGRYLVRHGTADGWEPEKDREIDAAMTLLSRSLDLGDRIRVSDDLSVVIRAPAYSVPIISWVQAGDWNEVIDQFQPGDAEEWIKTFRKVSDNAFALRILGDSMEPEFSPGDTIIVDPAVEPVTGKFVIAKIDDGSGENGEATFKQFVRDGNQVFLKPLNGKYPIMDMTGKKFRIVGCVVEKRKEY